MEDPRGREKRMGRVVIWRWTTPIGGEPELAFLPFPPFLLLFSFFSLSLVATQEGSGYFWNLPIHTLTRRSVNSTTRFDIFFLLQKHSSNLHESPRGATCSFPLHANQHAEHASRVSTAFPFESWQEANHAFPHSAIPVSNPRNSGGGSSPRRAPLDSRRDLWRLDFPLCDAKRKKKERRGTLSHFVDLDSAWISWWIELVAVLDRLLVLHRLMRPGRGRSHGFDRRRRLDYGFRLHALHGFHRRHRFWFRRDVHRLLHETARVLVHCGRMQAMFRVNLAKL